MRKFRCCRPTDGRKTSIWTEPAYGPSIMGENTPTPCRKPFGGQTPWVCPAYTSRLRGAENLSTPMPGCSRRINRGSKMRRSTADWPKGPIRERGCSNCNGTGLVALEYSKEPGRRVFPPRCSKCDAKARAATKQVARALSGLMVVSASPNDALCGQDRTLARRDGSAASSR